MAKDLMIGIGAEFRGAKAFKQADKAVGSLSKSVKNIAGSFGLAFGAAGAIRFAKQSALAFAEDNKAATLLTKTLDNLGLRFASQDVAKYVSNLEAMYGVADDQLRPALTQLLTATNNVAKSQSLFDTALNTAAGTGKDLSTVTTALSRAYLGNRTALMKLGLPLTKVQLQTMSLLDIQKELDKIYSGAAATAADTYKGKIDKLSIAVDNFKEKVGEGLFSALTSAGGAGGTGDASKAFDFWATKINNLSNAVGILLGQANMYLQGAGYTEVQAFRKGRYNEIMRSRQQYGGAYADRYKALAQAQADKKAAQERAKQLAATKALTKAQQDALKAKKLNAIFDQEQINAVAALQGNLTEEERKRVELMLAVQQGNVNEAQRLANELANIQGKTSMLATYLRTLPDAKNPFASWSDYLKAIEAQIARIANASPAAAPAAAAVAATVASNAPMGYAGAGSSAYSEMMSYTTPTTNVVVTVEGGDELTTLMRYKIAEASSSGSGVNWSQTVGAYDR